MKDTIVLHGGVPPPVETAKDADRHVHVDGAHIVIQQMLAAVLEHGSADRYYVLCDSLQDVGPARDALASYRGAERATVMTAGSLASVAGRQRVAMQMSNVQLFALDRLRRAVDRPRWPILGTTMLLSYQTYPGFPLMTLALLLGDLRPYDCLVCTSLASRTAVERLSASVRDALGARMGLRVTGGPSYAVIPLGVNVMSFGLVERTAARRAAALPEDGVIFLYFGRFAFDSKIDLFSLILIFAQLIADRRRRSDALPWLLLAGDDCEQHVAPHLATFAAELGIADRVIIRPDASRAAKQLCYASADAFVSPSDNPQETFGVTIIEAMASGLPVIASDWNGYRDHVRDGVEGFLVPTCWHEGIDYVSKLAMVRGDRPTHWLLSQGVAVDPAAFRQHMDMLVDAPEQRRAMGERARRRAATTYDWSVVVREYEALWESSLDAASAAGEEAERFGCGTSTSDYLGPFDMFGHYVTGFLTPDATIRLTSLGHRFADTGRAMLRDVAAGGVVSAETRRVAQLAAADSEWACGTLADRAATEFHAPAERMLQHVARLLKCGAVELV